MDTSDIFYWVFPLVVSALCWKYASCTTSIILCVCIASTGLLPLPVLAVCIFGTVIRCYYIPDSKDEEEQTEAPEERKCRSCAKTIHEDAILCVFCGTSFEKECPHCGGTNKEEASKCFSCRRPFPEMPVIPTVITPELNKNTENNNVEEASIHTSLELNNPEPNEYEKKCPQCAEIIKKEALICRFCRFSFINSHDAIEISDNPANPEKSYSIKYKKCPSCSEKVEENATICPFCTSPV